jgi:hypothetical protein
MYAALLALRLNDVLMAGRIIPQAAFKHMGISQNYLSKYHSASLFASVLF